ncbi:hypothetical protein [Longimicrobium sp.]|uniref:hypothetical protein n=1 Tax=Longimicrobium sp. TaxID=2029185 RepID=UPI002CB13E84|nr:hypothetical protein [Longimicrobium sp.]HSU14787.1 hypothetical protein [Longimicrobium sp.]
MKKLNLRPEDLHVESFNVAEEDTRRGTVHAQETTIDCGASGYESCPEWFTCKDTCDHLQPSCVWTQCFRPPCVPDGTNPTVDQTCGPTDYLCCQP